MNRPARTPLSGLLIIGLGASIAPMDFAVNVAFPAITAAFTLDVQSIRWVVICYVITYASLMLAFGKLGDIAGHRRVFHAGLLTGTVAFLACGLAPTYPWLLVARMLQGISTALVLSCAPALVVAVCGEQRRTWALSRYAMISALAGIAGPVIGGAAIHALGWSGAFWFRLPVTLLALVLLMRMPALPMPAGAPQRFDGVSSVLLAGGLALLLLGPGLWTGDTHGGWPVAVSLAGAALLAIFALRERRDAEPVLPRAAVRDPVLLSANFASVIVNLVGFAVPLLVPYYLARIGGFNAAMLGLLLAIATAGVLASSTATPRVVQRLGQRRATLLGAALIACAQGIIAFWPLTPSLAMVVAGLLLHGLGLGLFQVSYTDLVVAALPQRNRGVAGSLTMLTRTVGVILGTVVLGSAARALEARHLLAGQAADAAFHAAFGTVFLYSGLLLGNLLLAGLLWSVVWRRDTARSTLK